ncbi:MAG: hypothetical protein JRH20_16990 [Deltaproteobacteria bacterium]|nr:hypothetical protein [Deltaproteobacteria bacterium]
MRIPSRTFVILALCALPAIAQADPVLHGSGTSEPGHSIFGAKIVGGAAIDPEGSAHRRMGLALLYEYALIPHWLEGEISVAGMLCDHGPLLPVELLLKIPFHLNDQWEFYVGAGAAMVVDFDHEQAFFGGVGSVGTFFWLSDHFGLLFELDYLLLHEHGATHELEIGSR